MPDAMSDALATLRRAAEGLPHVVEGTSYGTPALKVGIKLLARLRGAETVVLPCALVEKALLIEAALNRSETENESSYRKSLELSNRNEDVFILLFAYCWCAVDTDRNHVRLGTHGETG